MNKEESVALFEEGRDAWNTWARGGLGVRAALEAEGTWVEGQDKPPWNEETLAWHRAAVADSSQYTFQQPADFSGLVFPGNAYFVGATFSDHAEFLGATFSGHAGFGGTTFSSGARF